jgi:hypothetical protein
MTRLFTRWSGCLLVLAVAVIALPTLVIVSKVGPTVQAQAAADETKEKQLARESKELVQLFGDSEVSVFCNGCEPQKGRIRAIREYFGKRCVFLVGPQGDALIDCNSIVVIRTN